jgi:hypothetical protein
MRYFLLSLFILLCLPAFTQLTVNVKWSQHIPPANSDTIYYSNGKKLSWFEFKAPFVYSAEVVALTSSGFGYQANIQYMDGKTDIIVEVYSYFNKKKSW